MTEPETAHAIRNIRDELRALPALHVAADALRGVVSDLRDEVVKLRHTIESQNQILRDMLRALGALKVT